MKIHVLGAGVIGVTTAYQLSRAGHEVVVFDKGSKEASGTSEKNGAQLSYSFVDPFASPGTLRDIPKYLLGLDPAIKFGFTLNPQFYRWGLNFLRNCTHRNFDRNFSKHIELAVQSKELVDRLVDELSIGDQITGQGKLVLTSSQKALEKLSSKLALKREAGMSLMALSKDDCLELMPSLQGWNSDIAGGIFSPDDLALDCSKFCGILRAFSEDIYGVEFRFEEDFQGLVHENGSLRGMSTNLSEYKCDMVVACLGNQTSILKEASGEIPNIYPMQGYSLTLPSTPETPKISVTDYSNKIVFANLGDKVRIAAYVDANRKEGSYLKRCNQLLAKARELWPNYADYSADPDFWTGYRPMTPSGVPFIGETKTKGLFINAGHGALGYTFAMASANKILEMIGGANRSRLAAE